MTDKALENAKPHGLAVANDVLWHVPIGAQGAGGPFAGRLGLEGSHG